MALPFSSTLKRIHACVRIQTVSVEINIPQFLQHLTDNKTIVEVTGENVGECLADFVRQFPQVRNRLFTPKGILHQYLEVFVNGKTSYPEELSKKVKNGDILFITNIIDGG